MRLAGCEDELRKPAGRARPLLFGHLEKHEVRAAETFGELFDQLRPDDHQRIGDAERVGQRSVGPEGLTSQAAVSCDLPKAAVL